MITIAMLASAMLILQIASPPEEPPLLYPMYLLIIGAGLGAAAQRIVLRKLSPWSAMLAGIIGSALGGYLGRAVFGHRDIALSGGLIGAAVGIAMTALVKRSSHAVISAGGPGPAEFSTPPAPPNSVMPRANVTARAEPVPRPSAPPPRSSTGDIFISYSSADRPFAQRLATALQGEGWSVWWDRAIPPGKSFDAVIEEALDAAKCVIVLWSKSSVASDWVKVEAAEAARRRILIPALIDSATIPLEFRRIQAASLTDWTSSSDHPGFVGLATSVRELLGAPH